MAHLNKHDRITAITAKKDDVNSHQQAMNDAATKLMKVESEYLKEWRRQNGRLQENEDEQISHINGLALSGGGIRSATFALGVLQALAHHKLLKKFDYLSTVSGGGYMGSALSWLLSHQANEARTDGGQAFTADNFPFGTDSPDPHAQQSDSPEQQAILNYMREHGHYLDPGAGINIFALLGVVLRGTALNLMVWLPLTILVLIVVFWLPQKIAFFSIFADSPWLETLLDKIAEGHYDWNTAFLGYELLLRLAAGIAAISLLGIIAYSAITWIRRSSKKNIISGLRWYKWRRLGEKVSSVLIPFTLVILIIGLLPAVTSYIAGIGPLALVVGIAMHLREFLGSLTADKGKPLSLMVSIGAALFLYGFFTVAFQLGYWIWTIDQTELVILLITSLIAVSLFTGFFANLNYISVHRFYRDRLMESFMPDIKTALKNATGMAKGADEAYLCCFNDKAKPTGPYHLINTNVVLVDSKNSTYQQRGGDNFILSPYFCGSNATGWCPTHEYMEGKMTLATAFAISAAAINPNTGVGGEGITRNRVLSLVLSLLNLRLGYWAHHPLKPPFNKIANHFNPSAFYVLGSAFNFKGFNENESFLELSDGGHFENMAVYELVRRKSRLILVSDAGEDAEFSFSDFQTTVRRIETDFGGRIDFHDDQYPPDKVLPKTPKTTVYPSNAKFSDQGYMVATIHYADNSEGLLVYLKSTLIKQASFKVKGYKAQNPDFPDQSTADQFFNDVQFEAYRELGFEITDSMINDPDLEFSTLL